eukprot:m.151708 g.151708  ORF g.151708 m.151708 type:complete len:298 (-) comp30774_c0_seq3:426-1319(-)
MTMETPKCGYLGCAPLNDANKEIMHDSMQLLMLKLEKLQVKMIERVVEKKHGSRLSSVSPVYQKIAAKMTKDGLDCRKGDPILVNIGNKTITLTDIKTNSINEIHIKQVTMLDIMPSFDETKVIFTFVQQQLTKLFCHGLMCDGEMAETLRSQLREKMAQLPKGALASEGKMRTASATLLGTGTITFGIGLHRQSSLRTSKVQRERRKKSVNLSGSDATVKFRPAGLQNTFASLGGDKVSLTPPMQRPEMVKSPDIVLEDDDLLDDLDDDLFKMDDMLEDDDMNPNDLDLSGMSFND